MKHRERQPANGGAPKVATLQRGTSVHVARKVPLPGGAVADVPAGGDAGSGSLDREVVFWQSIQDRCRPTRRRPRFQSDALGLYARCLSGTAAVLPGFCRWAISIIIVRKETLSMAPVALSKYKRSLELFHSRPSGICLFKQSIR